VTRRFLRPSKDTFLSNEMRAQMREAKKSTARGRASRRQRGTLAGQRPRLCVSIEGIEGSEGVEYTSQLKAVLHKRLREPPTIAADSMRMAGMCRMVCHVCWNHCSMRVLQVMLDFVRGFRV